jgi:hypothetical protein
MIDAGQLDSIAAASMPSDGMPALHTIGPDGDILPAHAGPSRPPPP